jgi:hypothetical protein
MADKPCNQCFNYDPILKGKGKQGQHGRCAVRSTYPAAEQKGQVFPAGVKREAPGELAHPFIVRGSEVMTTCALFKIRPTPRPAPKTPAPVQPLKRRGR